MDTRAIHIAIGIALMAASFVAVPAAADHTPYGCADHGGDTDRDGTCDDEDPDNDNDGVQDVCDPHPNSGPGENVEKWADWATAQVRGCEVTVPTSSGGTVGTPAASIGVDLDDHQAAVYVHP